MVGQLGVTLGLLGLLGLLELSGGWRLLRLLGLLDVGPVLILVLGVLSLILSKNEAIANTALQNSNLANTLFDLLRFSDSKKLALAQLVSLLRTPPTDVENFDLYRLCGTYINYMARLQEDTATTTTLAPLPEEYRFNLLIGTYKLHFCPNTSPHRPH